MLGLIAGIVQLIGYVWYVQYVIQDKKRPGTGISPNSGSWLIWAYGNGIVCWNYIIAGGLISLKEALPVLCSAGTLVCAILFLALRKFEKPSRFEIGILILDMLITWYWYQSGEHIVTQILLQLSVGISYVPIIRETKKDPGSERPGPWIVWTIAYVLLFAAEFQGSFWKHVYPLNYAFWCFVMALVSSRSKPPALK